MTLFRELGVRNVTWLWTVNIIHPRSKQDPAPGPGGRELIRQTGWESTATTRASLAVAPLFGPTIVAVRELTRDPIIIGETGATTAAGEVAKITDVFRGIREYGLLGFNWFDAAHNRDWRIDGVAAAAALRQGARTYRLPGS